MKYRTSEEIRRLFLEFFQSYDHMIEPGASLIPVDDDTLLWINSGVAALKKYFDGRVKPKNPRIANVQKSIRTNDIDNVGRTARHHTFFEMLGNFSIGDYFKKEAIHFAYEFLFSEKWIGLDKNHMYVSVHTEDTVAYDIWVNEIGVDPKRILRTDDNFWQIGDGPCGPNSEIFYDRGVAYDPENIGERLFFEDLENDRYIEVWNIVFSQYDGKEGVDFHEFKELPQKNIDTGMGFERLVSIVQNGETNFDTDLFIPILNKVSAMTTVSYKENVMAYRVIADHIRTLVFALNDGALFANEGRGYVLRRILRRAVRYSRVLGIEEAFLYTLVDDVIEIMNDFYPTLADRPDHLKKLILSEEKRFAKTLVDGERLLLDEIKNTSGSLIAGDVAFKLYDTYGFPIELTQEIAGEKGYTVDLEGFKKALNEQKERARSSRSKTESMGSQQEDILNFRASSEFLYDTFECQATITGLFVDGHAVDSLRGEGLVAVDRTPFYATSGGQVSDTGWIDDEDVTDVIKANAGQHLHKVNTEKTFEVGQTVTLKIDRDRRVLIRKNHSAVHLLHAALHQFIGNHVNQAGSYVDEDYFRLDFTHIERLDDVMLSKIERQVNRWIAQSLPIETKIMKLEDAKETGAMALFGDTYGEFVRVVIMDEVSKELCGGTHAINTGEIGVFRLVSEESVGSGVRRIVGKTSFGGYEALKSYEFEVETLRKELKLAPQKTVHDRVIEMSQEYESLEKQYRVVLQEVLKAKSEVWIADAKTNADGLTFVWVNQENQGRDYLNDVITCLRDRVDVVVVANKNENGLNFIVSASEKAISSGFKAGDIAKELAVATGGNGGGRPNFAQSGGKDISQLESAYQIICGKMSI